MILRHDVDTDPATARAMWEIDRAVGVHGSYYFRLATVDVALMREIEAGGGEVGYHYEELATLAKEERLRTPQALRARLQAARARFRTNLEDLRARTGLALRSAASHGDFVNRRLGVYNVEILSDAAWRSEVGIDFEVYDGEIAQRIAARFSDAPPPVWWRPGDPLEAVAVGAPVVTVLVHPRHWRASPSVNLRDDLRRAWEGLRLAAP
jgi:hypothetical protein